MAVPHVMTLLGTTEDPTRRSLRDLRTERALHFQGAENYPSCTNGFPPREWLAVVGLLPDPHRLLSDVDWNVVRGNKATGRR